MYMYMLVASTHQISYAKVSDVHLCSYKVSVLDKVYSITYHER